MPSPIAAPFLGRVDPVPGEAINSWLEATARHMDVPLGSIVRTLRLQAALRPPWTTWLSAEKIDLVATATGTASSLVESMTLGAYDGAALKLDPTTHRLDATFPFGAVRWSRFCPLCLSESNGRWKLKWRLGWAFACVRHNAVLVDHCLRHASAGTI